MHHCRVQQQAVGSSQLVVWMDALHALLRCVSTSCWLAAAGILQVQMQCVTVQVHSPSSVAAGLLAA
mgnify:CR=1 FL=1